MSQNWPRPFRDAVPVDWRALTLTKSLSGCLPIAVPVTFWFACQTDRSKICPGACSKPFVCTNNNGLQSKCCGPQASVTFETIGYVHHPEGSRGTAPDFGVHPRTSGPAKIPQ